jgi:hypothetical protein
MSTFLLTWNPERWFWDPKDRSKEARQVAAGRQVKDQWSTGNRNSDIHPGVDRAFLLRQGPEPRGIVASGLFTSPPFEDAHWDGTKGKLANYAKITWDVVLEDDDLLPLALLKLKIPSVYWEPPGGGVRLVPPADAALERLWASHTGRRIPGSRNAPKPPKRSKSQGWQVDPIKRKLVEDHAQDLLEKHYRKMKWKVKDTRRGNPFDAVATKGKQTRYLEAKGTETDGVSVLVTPGEVAHVRRHPGECVIGIVSGIRFLPDGSLDQRSGILATHDWDPDSGVLKPTAYTWAPPAATP